MFARLRRIWSRFLNKSRTIKNEPLNRVSLIVIILIDIFILINVFAGLDDVSRWHISPTSAYPCYSDWNNYREATTNKDYETIRLALPPNAIDSLSFQQRYQQAQEGHLGTVSDTCLKYGSLQDEINNSANQQLVKNLDQKQVTIDSLTRSNRNIRSQYDSTLLERIAGQPREQSINSVAAEKAKQQLDQNNLKISTLKQEISNLKKQLLEKPENARFITFLKDDGEFKKVESGYDHASFWHPTIQLIFQSLFLLPLILIASFVHSVAQRRGAGLISLISWHLLVIFFIPLVIKLFEFLQVGVIFQFLFDIVSALLGGLLFLISYVYILLIPLLGFGIIKFFQKFVFNPKVQAANRVQNLSCIRCAKRLRQHDSFCPHCGYYQFIECQNCHNPTYKHLPYCKECGYSQTLSDHV